MKRKEASCLCNWPLSYRFRLESNDILDNYSDQHQNQIVVKGSVDVKPFHECTYDDRRHNGP